MTEKHSRGYRIPLALQNIFLSSNRGAEVSVPPPKGIAHKVFSLTSRHDDHQQTKVPPKRSGDHDNKAKLHKIKAVGRDLSKSSPQSHLDSILRTRGYSTKRFKTLDCAYYNLPTRLQAASYGSHIVNVVKRGDKQTLRNMLEAGISPNPCNLYGGSLVHMTCRRGNAELLQLLIEHGCDVRVADEHGRTPLHDVCWAGEPCFEMIELILKQDVRLLHMADCRGEVPLSYVQKENWNAWIEFLELKKDEFWPPRDLNKFGEQAPPELALQDPNTRPIPNPKNALPIRIASRVAQGKIGSKEKECLTESETSEESDDESDDESELEDGSESDYDEQELLYLLHDCGLQFD